MPSKKKNLKPEPEPEPEPELDHGDYQKVIDELTHQLCELRTSYQSTGARNEELEERYRCRMVDRVDINLYLERICAEHAKTIEELTETLAHTRNRLERERNETKRLLHESEEAYKKAEHGFESDIKIQMGALNAYAALRQEKDALLAKYDEHEEETRTRTKFNRELIYNFEREQVIAKSELKKEIAQQCSQLKNDFSKSNDIRIAALVQRLVRENIALNNDLDRFQFKQRRLQQLNDALRASAILRRSMSATYLSERSLLQQNAKCQAAIIERADDGFDSSLYQNAKLNEAARLRQDVNDRVQAMHSADVALQLNVHCLEKCLQGVRAECATHNAAFDALTTEAKRLAALLLRVKLTIRAAAVREKTSHTDEKLRAQQRQQLFAELSVILDGSDGGPLTAIELESPMEVRVDRLPEIISLHAPSTDELLPTMQLVAAEAKAKLAAVISCEIIQDVEIGSELFLSESSVDMAAPPDEEIEEDDMGVSSSDDGQPPAEPTPEAPPAGDITTNGAEKPKSVETDAKK